MLRHLVPALRVAASVTIALVALGCRPESPSPPGSAATAARATPEFAGTDACAGCHAAQFASWQQSHHAHAMAEATRDSVLGDFGGVRFGYGDRFAEFFVRDERFWVRTDDMPEATDDAPAELEVRYTFGFTPLQQYLVETPGGRLQALNIAWDSRPAGEGGQRWFDLYEGETLAFDDPLHWTGDLHNWNSRCAACHTSAYEKRYHAADDRYESRYAAVDVGCEACHGPGSAHVDDPVGASLQLGSTAGQWTFAAAPIAVRAAAGGSDEVEICAACHSRRAQFADIAPGQGLHAAGEALLLQPELYYPDGQIEDEVFVWGSFVQSAMHAAGVTCSDCHDPHGTTVRRDGDALCAGCHRPDVYAAALHHRHDAAPAAPQCVDCHMPATTYMRVDPRRDHSLRVPRPDLTVRLGVPNACSNCHDEVPAERLAAAVDEWFPDGRAGAAHYGDAFAAARAWSHDRRDQLLAVLRNTDLPQIVRATALTELARQLDGAALDAIEAALSGDEVELALGALHALESAPPELRMRLAQRFLDHELLGLRLAAVRNLADIRDSLSPARRADFAAALLEYERSLEYNADTAEGRHALGLLRERLGDPGAAEAAYRSALELSPSFAPAFVNLADLLRRDGRESEGIALLEGAAQSALRGNASIRAALGFAYVRSGDGDAALASFAAAAEAAPDDPYLAYAHGLALDSLASRAAALARLEDAATRFPGYAPVLFALAAMYRDDGDTARALALTEALLEVSPGDANGLALRTELRSRL